MKLSRRQFFGFAAGATAVAMIPIKAAQSLYHNITIRFSNHPKYGIAIDADGANHPKYGIAIDADGASIAEIYERVQYLTRKV